MQCIINGIEVKVGQKWKDGKGVVHTIDCIDNGKDYPIWAEGFSWTKEGKYRMYVSGLYDLTTLVEDAENTPSTKEESYTLDQIIEALKKAFDWDRDAIGPKTLIKELHKISDPDYKKYLELKKKFEDA